VQITPTAAVVVARADDNSDVDEFEEVGGGGGAFEMDDDSVVHISAGAAAALPSHVESAAAAHDEADGAAVATVAAAAAAASSSSAALDLPVEFHFYDTFVPGDMDPLVPEAAAAAPSTPPPDVNRGGRPRLERPDLTAPSWRVPASDVETTAPADQTTGHLMNQLLHICTQHHLSDAAGKEMFDVLRKYLPGTNLPHCRQAKQIAQTDAPVNAEQFAVCSGDCKLHSLKNLSADELAKLRKLTCVQCDTPLVENKAFVKVS